MFLHHQVISNEKVFSHTEPVAKTCPFIIFHLHNKSNNKQSYSLEHTMEVFAEYKINICYYITISLITRIVVIFIQPDT